MYGLLTTAPPAHILGSSAGVAIAVSLLGLLVALAVYAGLYYAVPRMLKLITRRAIPVV
jgi:hypothetical protein